MAARKLKLRIKLCAFAALGPGKVALLEAVGRCGSISAAARDLKMSYRRAWLLLDEMNRAFRRPVIDTQYGGKEGGGARLTELGRTVIAAYRNLQRKAEAAIAEELDVLQGLLAEDIGTREQQAAERDGPTCWKLEWAPDRDVEDRDEPA